MNNPRGKKPIDIKLLLANVLKSRSTNFKVPFSLGNNKEVEVAINRICFVEAKGELSVIHFFSKVDGFITVAISIGQCEKLLDDFAFVRVHRSFIINCTFIKRIQLSPEAQVVLETNEIISISRRRKETILNYLADLGLSYIIQA